MILKPHVRPEKSKCLIRRRSSNHPMAPPARIERATPGFVIQRSDTTELRRRTFHFGCAHARALGTRSPRLMSRCTRPGSRLCTSLATDIGPWTWLGVQGHTRSGANGEPFATVFEMPQRPVPEGISGLVVKERHRRRWDINPDVVNGSR